VTSASTSSRKLKAATGVHNTPAVPATAGGLHPGFALAFPLGFTLALAAICLLPSVRRRRQDGISMASESIGGNLWYPA
jgi:hypothetical protein